MGRSISNRRPACFEKWVEFHRTWMVPPHQGMWIPGGVRHSIAMLSQVATRSVYLDQRAARGMPRQCEVVGVSPLLRQLLILAVDLPSEYDPRRRAGRIMSLLIDEIRLAPALPLSLPFPGDVRLASSGRRRRTRSICGAGRWA
jgi:hypothetical protein